MAATTPPKLSDSQTTFLICMYHGHEILWNTANPGYKNQQHRDLALLSLQANFEDKFGVKLEVGAIKTKLQSFRNSFSKELTLYKESVKSGAGTDEIYTPKYSYFQELIFLLPVVKKRASTTNLEDRLPEKPEDEYPQLTWMATTTRGERETVEGGSSSTQGQSEPILDNDTEVVSSAAATGDANPLSGKVSEKVPRPPTRGKNVKRNIDNQEVEALNSINSVLKKRLDSDTKTDQLTTWGINLSN